MSWALAICAASLAGLGTWLAIGAALSWLTSMVLGSLLFGTGGPWRDAAIAWMVRSSPNASGASEPCCSGASQSVNSGNAASWLVCLLRRRFAQRFDSVGQLEYSLHFRSG